MGRVDQEVLLPDQKAAHGRQQLVGDFTAALAKWLGEGPSCRIEQFYFAWRIQRPVGCGSARNR
jgi:hypothetical protein